MASAPFFYAEHEKPYDFHRFTQFAWKRMAAETGLTVQEITWLEGYYGTLAYQARVGASNCRTDGSSGASSWPCSPGT